MNEVLLFGLALPVVAVAVMQFVKMLVKDPSWWPWLTVVVGVVLAYLAQLVTAVPEVIPYVQPLIYGLVTFAGATGIYHAGRNLAGKDHQPSPGSESLPGRLK